MLIGRPFLYSLAYGEDGPKHLVDSKLYFILYSVCYMGDTDAAKFCKLSWRLR